MHTLNLPRRFWDDHCDRLSPDCAEIERARHSVVTLTDQQLAELLDDARHYAEGWADEAPAGLIASARATVQRINQHLETLEA